jgi:hypothetical protein
MLRRRNQSGAGCCREFSDARMQLAYSIVGLDVEQREAAGCGSGRDRVRRRCRRT